MIMGKSVKRPYSATCLTFVDVMVLSHASLQDVLEGGFLAHKTRIKSAAAWLNIRLTFLKIGKLMLRMKTLTGNVLAFDNPVDTLVFIQRLMAYGTSALPPERLGKKGLPETGPEYIVALLK